MSAFSLLEPGLAQVSVWLLVSFCFVSFFPSLHTVTQIVNKYVSSHNDVPNVFFKDVYLLRLGPCNFLSVHSDFVKGVKRPPARVMNGIVLVCVISLESDFFFSI